MKKLVTIRNKFLKHEQGNAWVINLEKIIPDFQQNYGDFNNYTVKVFENGDLLGPADSPHETIRKKGLGSYSQWFDSLYISSSDNSDPSRNRRDYTILLEIKMNEKVDNIIFSHGHQEKYLEQAVRLNINRNDSALYNLLHAYSSINYFLKNLKVSPNGKNALELGTSKEPGLPYVFLKKGARHFYSNNIFPVDGYLSSEYVNIIDLIMNGTDTSIIPTEDIIAKNDTQNLFFSDKVFSNHSAVGAEDLELDDNSIDILFSIAVMEHVSNPVAVIQNSFRMLKPGGICIHCIDHRDHRDFTKPIEFLKMTPEQYTNATGDSENRWRFGQFQKLYRDTGFEEVENLLYTKPLEINASKTTDNAERLLRSQVLADGVYSSLMDIYPWVSSKDVDEMAEPFRNMDSRDLSVLSSASCLIKPL